MAGRGGKPKVCRRLFQEEEEVEDGGAANPSTETNNRAAAIQEELKRIRQNSMRKWNFDFENERPLNGDWEWEKVEGGTEIVLTENGNIRIQPNETRESQPISKDDEGEEDEEAKETEDDEDASIYDSAEDEEYSVQR